MRSVPEYRQKYNAILYRFKDGVGSVPVGNATTIQEARRDARMMLKNIVRVKKELNLLKREINMAAQEVSKGFGLTKQDDPIMPYRELISRIDDFVVSVDEDRVGIEAKTRELEAE